MNEGLLSIFLAAHYAHLTVVHRYFLELSSMAIAPDGLCRLINLHYLTFGAQSVRLKLLSLIYDYNR